MNLYESELRVLRMLAKLKGSYLGLDDYSEATGRRLEQTNFPLPKAELCSLVKGLEEKGLAASILERLDGLRVALTAEGRKLMSAEGAVFDKNEVEHTRNIFRAGLCKSEM